VEASGNQQLTNHAHNQGPFLAEKGGHFAEKPGPTEIILHFFSRFYGFWGFCRLQPIAFQRQAAIRPLLKKSCLKTDGRFSLNSGMCHNRRMTVEMTGRNQGCERWAAVKRRPALRAQRFGARNDGSAFGHRAGKRPWRVRAAPKPVGLSGADQT
jgi:hypothetical protein